MARSYLLHVHHTGACLKYVYRRIQTLLSHLTIQYDLAVQMGLNGLHCSVCQIIGRNIDGLEGGDRSLGNGVDTLLHLAYRRFDIGRITVLDRHTGQLRVDLGHSLYVTVDIVYEEKHVLSLLVTEILGRRQTGEYRAAPGCGVVAHLSEYDRHLIQKSRLLHLVVKLAALTGTLADSDEDGVGIQSCIHVVDQLLDQDGFAYACAAQEAHLVALLHGSEEIQHLDSSPQISAVDIDLLQLQLPVVDASGLLLLNGIIVNQMAVSVKDLAQNLIVVLHGQALVCLPYVQPFPKARDVLEGKGMNDAPLRFLSLEGISFSFIVYIEDIPKLYLFGRIHQDLYIQLGYRYDFTDTFTHFFILSLPNNSAAL